MAIQRQQWTGRSNRGRSKAHRYGRVKTLLTQGRLLLLDSAELRAELTEITVSPSASDPGYTITTHGPDDMADAAVMAVTECIRPKVPEPHVYNMLDGYQYISPSQRVALETIYGSRIPDYAVDRDGR